MREFILSEFGTMRRFGCVISFIVSIGSRIEIGRDSRGLCLP
jgi:hypothetical protein